MMYLSFSPVLLLLLLSVAARLCISQEFVLDAQRETSRSNQVQLICITNPDESITGNRGAVFFLNGTSLEDLGVTMIRSMDGVLILVNRETEGVYSCALPFDRRISNEVTLVALPEDGIPSFPRTFFAEVGSTAVMNCSITPGRLLQQYSVLWFNGTEGQNLAQIPPLTTPTATPPDPRYTIDPVTFSLIISNVALSDSDPSYRCILRVRDPLASNRLFTYTMTQDTNLQLVVYKPPRIITPPSPATISLADAIQAHFDCSAIGDPAPKISWVHNNQKTISPLKYHVNEFTPTLDPRGRGFVSRGSLGIFPLVVEDSGSVKCVASVVASDDTTGGATIPKDTAATSLAILGGFQSLDVLVTQDGDLIYRLLLGGKVHTPVNLFFTYTRLGGDDDGEVGAVNQTATATYNNTNFITHIEFRSQVPFQKFRVGVALVDRFLLGPINRTDRSYDISRPSIISLDSTKLKLFLVGFLPISAFISIILLLIIISCIIGRTKRRRAEFKFKEGISKRPIEVLEALAENVPSAMYPEFLKFAEKVWFSACDVCQENASEDGKESLEEGMCDMTMGEKDEQELVGEGAEKVKGQVAATVRVQGVMMTKPHEMPSMVLKATATIIETGLGNPVISGRLSDMMVAMLVSRGKIETPRDPAYSSSAHSESKV